MKLSSQQVAAVKQELGADPLPDTNPAMESLRGAFGDHTFYVGVDGLFVFEPVNEAEASDDSAQLILVAAWTDENKNALTQVPPQRTDKVVDLAAAGDDGSAGGSGGNGAA